MICTVHEIANISYSRDQCGKEKQPKNIYIYMSKKKSLPPSHPSKHGQHFTVYIPWPHIWDISSPPWGPLAWVGSGSKCGMRRHIRRTATCTPLRRHGYTCDRCTSPPLKIVKKTHFLYHVFFFSLSVTIYTCI